MDPTITAAIIATLPGVATLVLAARNRRHTAVIRAEVKNSHTTNLREDVDKVLDKLDAVIDGQARHDSEIAGLRTDMRVERQERLALADRLKEALPHD
jgi:hypothetical protein